MGYKTNAVLIALVGVFIYAQFFRPDPPVPDVPAKWWGPEHEAPAKEDSKVVPFTINIPESVLVDLKQRLSLPPRLVRPIEGAGFTYGFNHDQLEKVRKYWLNEYDWRKHEKALNKFRHFKTRISGLQIHFIHELAAKTAKVSIPLAIFHGWPGSIVEFYKIIPILTDPAKLSRALGREVEFAFEVIAPSLPGYGFSEGTSKPGLSVVDMAPIMKRLMERLGFETYFVQGGDWGSFIASSMATLYPDNVRGLHMNMAIANTLGTNLKMILGSLKPQFVVDAEFIPLMYPFLDKFGFLLSESGYMHIQATKPDTIGAVLNSSPLGLAAYIMEKFVAWTNRRYLVAPDGKLTEKFTMDELLTNVMVYWSTDSITTSMRLYKESFVGMRLPYSIDDVPVHVAAGVAVFPEEISVQPRNFLQHKYYNITHFTLMERGGHFAAFEEPVLLAREIGNFVSNLL